MHVILDYGMGNTASVEKAIQQAGFSTCTSSEISILNSAETIIVPGVGTFPDAMQRLKALKLVDVLRDLVLVKKKRYLGFCLGMQILAEYGFEGEKTAGLGFLPGEVLRIPDSGQSIPHMGWDDVVPRSPGALGELTDRNFYFMHSYYLKTDSKFVTSTVDYGAELTATVEHQNIFGAQFHPEKSQTNGLIYLRRVLGSPSGSTKC